MRTVKVSCATNTFTIRGTVSGLQGSGLVLQNNGGDDVGVQSDGGFAFATQIPSGSQYSVTVKTQPESSAAGVLRAERLGHGRGLATSRTSPITCVLREFTIGGTLSGLGGSGLVLANNGGDHGLADGGRPVYVPDCV